MVKEQIDVPEKRPYFPQFPQVIDYLTCRSLCTCHAQLPVCSLPVKDFSAERQNAS